MAAKKKNRTPNYMKVKRTYPRHIILKLSKVNDKEGILKIKRENKTIVTYKENPNR